MQGASLTTSDAGGGQKDGGVLPCIHPIFLATRLTSGVVRVPKQRIRLELGIVCKTDRHIPAEPDCYREVYPIRPD